jgi:hypothetical protein
MSAGIPIVYIHESKELPGELFTSMMSAHISNPASPIYLLTNVERDGVTGNKTFDDALTYIDTAPYKHATEPLGEVFFNISRMPGTFERMCLDRWFMLRSFVKERGFRTFFTLDSDVLLFINVSDEVRRFQAFDYTVSSTYNWCHALFNNADVLNAYCDSVLEVYSRSTPLWRACCDYINLFDPSKQVLGLGDMILAGFFSEHVAPTLGYTFEYTAKVFDGISYCSNMYLSLPDVELKEEKFEQHSHTIKKLFWIDGLPYGKLNATGELIRLACLHFQGESKVFMGEAFTRFIRLLSKSAVAQALPSTYSGMEVLQESLRLHKLRHVTAPIPPQVLRVEGFPQ